MVNEKIRHHRLSAKEIHFCRDSTSNKPIHLDDEEISDIIQTKREEDNSSKYRKANNKIAKSAEASQGQLVFVKSEGDKSSRRDLYLVLEQGSTEDSLIICKVRDALSQKPATISPQDNRYRYEVKQTDVRLAPNQPKITPCQALDDEEDREWEETEDDENIAVEELNDENDELDDLWIPAPPQQQVEDEHHHQEPPESDEEAQEAEYDADEEFQESDESSSEENGRENDDENLINDIVDENEVPEPDSELPQEPATNQEAEEEPAVEQEVEVDQDTTGEEDATVAEEAEEDHENDDHQDTDAEQEQELAMLGAVAKQSKKPVKGDTIAFVKGDYWIRAKIKNRVTGYPNYYNVYYEDGQEDGLYLNPPTNNKEESWTFIHNSQWRPTNIPEDNIEKERREHLARTNTPVSLLSMTMDQVQVHSNNSSMDWDNYASEPTYYPLNKDAELPVFTNAINSIKTIEHSEETDEEIGIFIRQNAMRRKRPGAGFSASLIAKPDNLNVVNLAQPNNLDSILLVRRPIIPELVEMNDQQNLDLVLKPVEAEEGSAYTP